MMTMPPIDPDLRRIRAKSDGESLADHTWHVLARLADQLRLRPTLAHESGSPRLWHWLYWGTFLHDFGKAARGFQAVISGRERRWGFRHEALSLAFVEWLFPADHPDHPYVIAVIACHHRDADVIVQTYQRSRLSADEDSATKLIAQLDEADIRRLYRWLADHSMAWAEALGFAPVIEPPALPPLDAALRMITPGAVHRTVADLDRSTNPKQFDDPAAVVRGALLRGLILIADHAGSAHSDPFTPAPLDPTAVTAEIGAAALFPHQAAAADATRGSMLLISPTGSGKTEAALLWLARQQAHDGLPAPRLFYLLPYQASMNAAQGRLRRIFREENAVGLQHSRMMQVLYTQALANDADNDVATAYAQQQRELAGLLRFPVTVMSPYQVLKVPYQLKGFEALLANFYGARFILDEIHAYEPRRLALIIAVMRFLQEHCHARCFIMTATLPPPVRAKLTTALPSLDIITAAPETFQRFQRHRVHLLNSDLLAPDNLERIVNDAADKSILICCNTVRRAFEVHAAIDQALRQRYAEDEYALVLLHSRFNSRDRNDKERLIIERTGVNSARRGHTIVVATQVIEVSLNIDLDTLYSEAAPLEALLQRFGRVNRARPVGSPLADVFVVREQPEAVKYIYDLDLIAGALACLEEADGTTIDESRVDEWLARVYTGAALERWEQAYAESWGAFHHQVLRQMRPFRSSDLDQMFYELFDGVDVLPFEHLAAYEGHIRAGEFLQAAGYMVPVAWRDYKRLERMGKAWHDRPTERSRYLFVVDAAYDSASGLDLYGVYNSPATPTPTTEIDAYEVPMEAD